MDSIGDHIKARRLALKLTQQEAALRIGQSESTILNWEKSKTEVPTQAFPAVLVFLGYDPFPAPTTLSQRMQAKRRQMGWSIEQAARKLGVDAGTWGQWEQSGHVPWDRYRRLLDTFLEEGV